MSRGPPGQFCLREIIVSYGYLNERCDMRCALAREIPEFKRMYPSITISIRPRSTPSHTLTGVYDDGSHLVLDVRFASSQQILSKMHELRGTANDAVHYFGRVYLHRDRDRHSTQGTWNPWLWQAERPQPRNTSAPRWNRTLNDPEWDYYVNKYTRHWQQEEEHIRSGIQATSDMPRQYAEEVQARWDEQVLPHLPSDMEEYAEKIRKAPSKARAARRAPTFDEYMMFAQPDMYAMGNDALCMLRKKKAAELVHWWAQRKDQLKDPG